MKIAIIGAGNMGGAIACGLAASGEYKAGEIICANPSRGKLDVLKMRYDIIATTTDNVAAAKEADMVIIAVKPWGSTVMPYAVSSVATEFVGWNTDSIVSAIRRNTP